MEIWKSIPGHEGYEVSNHGRVRSIDRVISKTVMGKEVKQPRLGRLLTLGSHRKGYLVVKTKGGKFSKVHRLVAMAFVDGDQNLQVNHKNGIKTDNRVTNLEWVTAKQNTQHAVKTGQFIPPFGESNGNSKLNNDIVVKIRSNRTLSRKDLCHLYNVTLSTINKVINNTSWKHVKSNSVT